MAKTFRYKPRMEQIVYAEAGLHSANDMLSEDENYDSSISWLFRLIFCFYLYHLKFLFECHVW